MIFTPPALRIDIEEYPAIKEYLLSFGKRIEPSGAKGSRKKSINKWFELQDSIAYHKDFEKEKIVYPETTHADNFFLDEKGEFFIDKTGFILLGTSLKYLMALLPSKFITYAYKLFYSGVTLGEEGYQYNKHALEKLPIPQIPKGEQKPFTERADQIIALKKQGKDTTAVEKEIDGLVYGLYGLAKEEIKEVEKQSR